ncbi:DUF6644 family protein [Massilia norwichensis]|uniref:DUF6644 domain-containing protein n=1 Tax=Massilia norwichensis TaxID=1442366 RepID=A0ABT2A805_9BURK|nr:DUF6644 family protein [Massilia norwichensis]MCS0590302.1 hypothetical protein [Massilia norwichensis]
MLPAHPAAGPGPAGAALDWTHWLAATSPALAMRANAWLYPAVEIVHIAGFAVLVGAVAMFDLRVLGLGRALPVRLLAHYLLPWSVGSMLLVLPSGLLLFAAEAPDLAANRVFLLKLVLIAVAGLNALAFHAGPYRSAERWDSRAPPRARLHAVLSLLLWLTVIACGRLLAYV